MAEETQELKPDSGSPEPELEKTPDRGSAGTGEETPAEQPSEEKPENVLLSELDKVKDSLKKAEEQTHKAEGAVVKYKRIVEQAKAAGYVSQDEEPKEDELLQRLESVEQTVASLKEESSKEEVSEIQRAHRKIEELQASLRAKSSITNSSIGTNQDKPSPKPKVNLNPLERSILERRAQAHRLSLEEYLEKHPIGE